MTVRIPILRSCGCKTIPGERCPHMKARKAAYDKARPNATDRGYSQKFKRARAEFLAANPRCAVPGCTNPATVLDHKKAHRGDQSLFWNRNNWQPLCRLHHDTLKQSIEKRGKS